MTDPRNLVGQAGAPLEPADADARRTALDPRRSFIVQAPAGSGKTEMLIQRLLVLLACVDAPEEVVALTFTRKAAGEMRSRLIKALEGARFAPPEAPHRRATWTLARAVLDRSNANGWDLLQSPGQRQLPPPAAPPSSTSATPRRTTRRSPVDSFACSNICDPTRRPCWTWPAAPAS